MFSHSQKKIERNSHEAKNIQVACFKSTLISGDYLCLRDFRTRDILRLYLNDGGINSELRQPAISNKI